MKRETEESIAWIWFSCVFGGIFVLILIKAACS
jgi:hypothetical protein